MGIFGRKKKEPGAAATGTATGGGDGATRPLRDAAKAAKFFTHANSVANPDYAIECFVNGLRHDPGNLREHERLREVAKKRKLQGGKPASFGEKISSGGKDPVERMLHAELLLAKDPLNRDLMVALMERAVEADKAEPEHHLGEVAFWAGELLLAGRDTVKAPGKEQYVLIARLFGELGNFDRAVESCSRALQLDPLDAHVAQQLKNYEAENTMQRNRFSGKEGGYRAGIADLEKQQELLAQDTTSKTQSQKDLLLERYRRDLAESPQDTDRLKKLADALSGLDTDAGDDEAIDLFRQAWQQTGHYIYKVRMGDIRIKGFARCGRVLQQRLEAGPDEAAQRELHELTRQRLAFELEEYGERVSSYPTDMKLRYELARRLYQAGRYDDAIAAFQMARTDPSRRAQSNFYLGLCYLHKDWLNEAIDSFRKSRDLHPISDDQLGKESRFQLMQALLTAAGKDGNLELAREAEAVGSQILQTDIKYKDIQQRLSEARALIRQLEKAGAAP